MKTALEQNREDQALGAAWRRCEAALPERTRMGLVMMPTLEWRAWFMDTHPDGDLRAIAARPTEALTALAEALEKREADLYASNMEWEHEVGT